MSPATANPATAQAQVIGGYEPAPKKMAGEALPEFLSFLCPAIPRLTKWKQRLSRKTAKAHGKRGSCYSGMAASLTAESFQNWEKSLDQALSVRIRTQTGRPVMNPSQDS